MTEKNVPVLKPLVKDFLSVKQLADHLGVHPQTVRRWLRNGLIKTFVQYGPHGHYKIHRSILSSVLNLSK